LLTKPWVFHNTRYLAGVRHLIHHTQHRFHSCDFPAVCVITTEHIGSVRVFDLLPGGLHVPVSHKHIRINIKSSDTVFLDRGEQVLVSYIPGWPSWVDERNAQPLSFWCDSCSRLVLGNTQIVGAGAPVVLIHGFGVDARLQWGETGLIEFLAPRFRVIALDCRGHGRSERFYDPDAYAMRNMSGDVLNLLDYLQIDSALVVGFSLGSRVCFEIMTTHPERCRAAVLSGFGPDNASSDAARREQLATAMLAADAASITEYQRRIRRAVLGAGNDPSALAACIRCNTNIPPLFAVTPISVPVFFVKGAKDYVAGDPGGLSGYFRESHVLVIDSNGHASVVADPRFHTAVADFLAAAPT
jgi:pimeloyl-ACP methyl ester carboxylesterase